MTLEEISAEVRTLSKALIRVNERLEASEALLRGMLETGFDIGKLNKMAEQYRSAQDKQRSEDDNPDPTIEEEAMANVLPDSSEAPPKKTEGVTVNGHSETETETGGE